MKAHKAELLAILQQPEAPVVEHDEIIEPLELGPMVGHWIASTPAN